MNFTTTRTDGITTYRMITNVFTVTYRGTENEHAYDGPDFVQIYDLRGKIEDRVSHLRISSDWRGKIYALEVNTNISFLTVVD